MISSINTHRMNCKNCKKTRSSSSTGWLCSSTRIQWMDRREGSGFGSSSTEWLGTSICIERIETKQRSCNNGSSSTGRSCTSICILWIERRLRKLPMYHCHRMVRQFVVCHIKQPHNSLLIFNSKNQSTHQWKQTTEKNTIHLNNSDKRNAKELKVESK